MESDPVQHQSTKPRVCFLGVVAKSDQCLKSRLGDKVDLKWKETHGLMEIYKSENTQFHHSREHHQENFRGVPFLHSPTCPFFRENLNKNHKADIPPCVVVLLRNKHSKKILATQRHPWMSFGGQWVLPGGHLEPGEDVIKGGLRECQEEVGLPLEAVAPMKDLKMMAWESVNVDEKKGLIKRAALVLFIEVQVDDFQVRAQEKEVSRWEWRDFSKEGSPWGGGWAEGHLAYLEWLMKKESVRSQ